MLDTFTNSVLSDEITALKRRKNAVILAHYYQVSEIQDVADFVGDSLALSQEAAKTNADIIVFAGVHFMAETAKIINPNKKVLLPDLEASCSLAESCPADSFSKFIALHPNHIVVSYINCSAEVKALSDIICTSSNAEKIIRSIPLDREIIFGPDKNLGQYLQKKTGRNMLIWDGACSVHEAFSLEKIQTLLAHYPEAELVAHPESENQILEAAQFIGSTTAMINYITNSPLNVFILATEVGILHTLKEALPKKLLIAAPIYQNNTCQCSECPYMKKNTMEKLLDCLLNETPEIKLNEEIRLAALRPIERMLSY